MNRFIATVIVAPMSTKKRDYPIRVSCGLQEKKAQIVLNQIRTVDKSRLLQKLGEIDRNIQTDVLTVLSELFAP